MMNKTQTIEKIMKEYEGYGIQRGLAELLFDMAIQKEVPEETIYQGMRWIFNRALGIDCTEPIEKVGENFVEHAMNVSREDNPTVTDDVLVKNFKEEIGENFDWSKLTSEVGESEFASKLTDSIKTASEKFIVKEG